MSTPNPEQPTPPPRTPSIFPPSSIPMDDWIHVGHYEELKAWADARISQLERELNAAKQPVPDAGVREFRLRVKNALIGYYGGCGGTVLEVTELVCALFPAPTPATSEDTLMLTWLENKALGASIHASLDEIIGQSKWTSLRQALRAARATTKGAE